MAEALELGDDADAVALGGLDEALGPPPRDGPLGASKLGVRAELEAGKFSR
jgi:hypothetical protein